MTGSPTASETATETRTESPTPSSTPSNSPTHTPTSSITETSYATETETPEEGLEIILYPNPVKQIEPIAVHVGHLHSEDRVEVDVFTTAYRKMASVQGKALKGGPQEFWIRPEDFKGGFPANGVYYVRAATRWESKILKLMVLR